MADDITGMYEVLAALKAVISSAAPDKRDALAQAMDGYAEHFPEEFFWATGGQSPLLLHHLMTEIDVSCRPDDTESKPPRRKGRSHVGASPMRYFSRGLE